MGLLQKNKPDFFEEENNTKKFKRADELNAYVFMFGNNREGKLQVIQLRQDENNISDGHLNVFIKSEKLYLMHWWFPC